ncbi:C39 family peptidase [Neobacillus sp. DY30]|uniref:C39 family peptidase n=1 Tax=Neobacillus sp. DY30 TaxID=3047871 RepID=UPI0024C038EA|nr:C39 family peptidase [Neobacillus sp. DY30]WHY01179.1 C39 family peptidase [Neobacillus sp. DY30]
MKNQQSKKITMLSLLLILPIYYASNSPIKTSAEYKADFHIDRTIIIYEKEPVMKESILLAVPTLQQFPELPRGCEVTSLAMLLNFAGVSVDKLTLADEIPKVPYFSDGYFGNPHQGFVGNMYTYNQPGLGVYHEVIEELANKYLPGQIENLTGDRFSSVQKKLNEGKPVWVIVASTFTLLSEDQWETWTTNEGEVNITRRMHSILITGYDDKNVYFNDPFYPDPNRSANLESFVASWFQFGSQAISY